MSYTAFRHIAGITTLAPHEKLVMMTLASFHNEATGQCNPSPERIAQYSKLSAPQVRTIVNRLVRLGLLERIERKGFLIAGLPDPDNLEDMPSDWRPSEKIIAELVELFPKHHFDIEEAINDFKAFCQRRGIKLQPENRDQAFIRNISTILGRRRPGPVTFSSESNGSKPNSVHAFLSRLP